MAEIIEALKQALDFENKGEQAYRDIIVQSEDLFIKNIFNSLADDEAEHARVIEAYADSIESDTFFDFEKELEQIKDNNPQRIFGMSIQEFKDMSSSEDEELVPFDTGIKLEEESIKFYTEKLLATDDDQEKQFFHFIIQQEEMHRSSLIKAKDFLSDPQNSFNEMESWLLDGGSI